jgi:alpha-ketoglutarate-dependent taurine dioxygenase
MPDDQDASPFVLNVLHQGIAGEITGFDASAPLNTDLRQAVLGAFNACPVLVFRNQMLDKPDQIAFSEAFGDLELAVNRDFRSEGFPMLHEVSNLDLESGKPTSKLSNRGNYYWHTDKSYMPIPSLATILYAVTLPPEGGDTLFAHMGDAYDVLPQDKKSEIETLRMVHSWERTRIKSRSKLATEEEIEDAPPVVHPLVRTHPETGRKSLYLGTHASHVDGMARGAGEALLAELQDFATQERFIYRHKWHPGDLVMWDNRCLLHQATEGFDMDKYVRLLHRTVVRGDAPV